MSVTCRKQIKTKREPSPFPMVNFNSEQDEHGNVKLTVCEPVALSLAEDYSILSNAAAGKTASPRYRVSSDPVDMPNKLNQLI